MLKSMTAYGRATTITALGRFVVEIQSVNRKHLEINVLLPKELTRFDADIRKLVGTQTFRGQVNVKVSVYFDKTASSTVTPNLPLAKQLKAAWEAIAKELKLDASEISLELLSKEDGILLYSDELQDEEQYRTDLTSVVQEALEQFAAMRIREGEALLQDITSRLTNLRHWLDRIVVLSKDSVSKYRQKLVERLESIVPSIIEDEERILREICLFADRIDIAEEVTRFYSHLDQWGNLLLFTEAKSIGKTLEFLLQEMSREVNTIGSKSSDIEISHLVVDMKSDLERIREQIQNVE